MTTTFPTDNRNILNEADATTGYTATDGPVLFTTAPSPIEAGGCLAMQVSNTTENAYFSITSDDYSNGGTLSVWMQDRAEFDLTSNTGIGIVVGDGTNRIAYAVGGSDGTAFRHDTGPVKWACFLLDIANKPANFVALAGSEANLNEAAITQVGVYFNTVVKSVGGTDNCFWDIIRWADNGDDVVMQGGATSGAAGNASEAAVVDRSTGNQQAYGVIRELGSGVYGIQGNLTIGNSASSSDQYWSETNVTYSWEDRGLSANNYYRFSIIGSATATNCEASFNACTFAVPSGASASFNGNGANLTVCNITSSTFIGFDQGVETSDDTGDDWTGCTYIGCDEVVANGCDISNSSFTNYVGAANGACLTYDLNVDPDGELDNLTFEKTTGTAHHAIDFGANIPTSSITLRNCNFGTNFSASENTSPTAEAGDETFAFRDTTGTLTVNLIECTGNFGFYSAGVDVTIVADPVTTLINVNDNTGAPLLGARVIVRADGSPGTLPYLDSVTASRTTDTVTVTHTGHGLPAGNKVELKGFNQPEYNGVKTISNVTTNTYDFIVNSPYPAQPTGTATSTALILEGTTDSSGQISDQRTFSTDQPISGIVRKGTNSPYFRDFPISGTIDSAAGLTISAQLILDE